MILSPVSPLSHPTQWGFFNGPNALNGSGTVSFGGTTDTWAPRFGAKKKKKPPSTGLIILGQQPASHIISLDNNPPEEPPAGRDAIMAFLNSNGIISLPNLDTTTALSHLCNYPAADFDIQDKGHNVKRATLLVQYALQPVVNIIRGIPLMEESPEEKMGLLLQLHRMLGDAYCTTPELLFSDAEGLGMQTENPNKQIAGEDITKFFRTVDTALAQAYPAIIQEAQLQRQQAKKEAQTTAADAQLGRIKAMLTDAETPSFSYAVESSNIFQTFTGLDFKQKYQIQALRPPKPELPPVAKKKKKPAPPPFDLKTFDIKKVDPNNRDTLAPLKQLVEAAGTNQRRLHKLTPLMLQILKEGKIQEAPIMQVYIKVEELLTGKKARQPRQLKKMIALLQSVQKLPQSFFDNFKKQPSTFDYQFYSQSKWMHITDLTNLLATVTRPMRYYDKPTLQIISRLLKSKDPSFRDKGISLLQWDFAKIRHPKDGWKLIKMAPAAEWNQNIGYWQQDLQQEIKKNKNFLKEEDSLKFASVRLLLSFSKFLLEQNDPADLSENLQNLQKLFVRENAPFCALLLQQLIDTQPESAQPVAQFIETLTNEQLKSDLQQSLHPPTAPAGD